MNSFRVLQENLVFRSIALNSAWNFFFLSAGFQNEFTFMSGVFCFLFFPLSFLFSFFIDPV